MTARPRKKPELRMPALACQVLACGQEYAPIGDYADTDRAALLGGWVYRAGQWLCRAHRDHIPWWPGRPLLALPQREPGATTRAEFVGVVPRDVSWSTAALPAPEPDLEPLPPENKCGSDALVWGPAEAGEKTSRGRVVPAAGWVWTCGCGAFGYGYESESLADDAAESHRPGDGRLQPVPAGPPAHPWQAAMEAELSEQALAGGEPLESLAPGQEDEEAEA